jgi:hypothetical protein
MVRGRLKYKISSAVTICAAAALTLTFATVSKTATTNLPVGKVPLTSAGPMAFGPDGVLFVADSMGAQTVAIDTKDTKAAKTASINVEGIDAKIAALVGVPADQIVINSVKVNPISNPSSMCRAAPRACSVLGRRSAPNAVPLRPVFADLAAAYIRPAPCVRWNADARFADPSHGACPLRGCPVLLASVPFRRVQSISGRLLPHPMWERGQHSSRGVAHPVLWTQHCSRCYRLEVLAPGLGR